MELLLGFGFGTGGIQPSTNPALCNCYFKVWAANMTARAGQVFTFTLLDPMATTDAWDGATELTATSDSVGLVQVTLGAEMKWRMRGPDGGLKDFFTGHNQSLALPEYLIKH